MTRLEALEAVAAAAQEIAGQLLSSELTSDELRFADFECAYNALIESIRPAIRALNALPAQPQPQGETVTWVAWEGDNGEAVLCRAGSILDTPERGWTRLGTVTLPLERGP